MPGFDGTGPMGLGPMTGWGMGYCALPLPALRRPVPFYSYAGPAGIPVSVEYPAFYAPFWGPRFGMGFRRGPGFGRGFGMGRGRRRWFFGYW